MTMTWLDIAFALLIVSRYCINLDSTHITAVTQILQYIKDTLNDGIIFRGGLDTHLDLIGYTNTYYRSAKEHQKSIRD